MPKPVKEEKEEEVVEYHPSRRIEGLDGTERLTDMAGKTITIEDVDFIEAGRFTVAKVKAKEGVFRTTSEVLVKQLKEIKQLLDEGKAKAVKAKVIKRGRYYTFE
jgi:soluble cytochrome b562